MSEPLIVGIRHHSPACARLVKSLIESQRPRYVLIEGPADFNDRVDELFFSHQLPVAIYSYCQYQDGAAPGRGAWTPFAEFSPEWQALQAARRIQAQTYFIDLPCWAQSEEEDDSPDTQDESQALLLRATRKRAQALVAKGITIELFCAPGEIPSARLPMSDVRFYSRSSIRFARCDCIEGTLCEHVVLAVQAFVEAKAQQAEFNHLIWQMRSEHVTSSDDPFASEEGQTCRQYVQQLSQALWLGGISQPLIHYEAAFNRALQAAEACNWRWVSESLRQLRASVDAFHTRASHYHAGECLRQLAALNSRLNCAQEMARRDSVGEVPPVPWRTVVGSGIAGEAKLDHLRLVSLGMRCWQDIEHYGLRIWFTDPDTGSILHLSRSWPRSEQENSPAATRRLFSFQAGALAGGQIVSQAAKRSADGELLLATRNRLSSVVPLSPDAWQMLSAPLRQPGIVALREYLRQRPPACIRPLNQVDNLFILPVAECISLGWDSSRQTLDAQVISGEGEDNLLTLSLPASACSPFAVERMAALLQQTDDPVSLVVSVNGAPY